MFSNSIKRRREDQRGKEEDKRKKKEEQEEKEKKTGKGDSFIDRDHSRNCPPRSITKGKNKNEIIINLAFILGLGLFSMPLNVTLNVTILQVSGRDALYFLELNTFLHLLSWLLLFPLGSYYMLTGAWVIQIVLLDFPPKL